MLEQNKRLAGQFIALAFSGQMDAAQALLSPSASWWVLGQPEKLRVAGTRDRAGIKRLLTGVGRSLPQGMQANIKGVIAEGGRVAIELEAVGDTADGRVYRNQYHFVIELRDGLIESVREYMDTMAAFEISQPPV